MILHLVSWTHPMSSGCWQEERSQLSCPIYLFCLFWADIHLLISSCILGFYKHLDFIFKALCLDLQVTSSRKTDLLHIVSKLEISIKHLYGSFYNPISGMIQQSSRSFPAEYVHNEDENFSKFILKREIICYRSAKAQIKNYFQISDREVMTFDLEDENAHGRNVLVKRKIQTWRSRDYYLNNHGYVKEAWVSGDTMDLLRKIAWRYC